MRYRNVVLIPLILMTATGLALGAGLRGLMGRAPCERAAQQLFTSCILDVQEEHGISVANCFNVGDADERADCFADAAETRGEDNEECGDVREARRDTCELLDEFRYDPDPLLDPSIEFVDPDDISRGEPVNPWVSLAEGHTYVLRAGEDFEELVIVHVTGETVEISGVPCRVVVDIVLEVEEADEGERAVEYEVVEATDDWFAQDSEANVYYCGEISRNYEDGFLVDIDGSFRSGYESAKAGILIKAAPIPGDAHRQEFALDEAEDVVEYLSLAGIPGEDEGGENADFPCAPGGCLQTRDSAALDPGDTEYKYYIDGVGFVLAVALEDGEPSGEREELVCIGDSLDVLASEACGIENLAELLDELCELSPDAFCD